MPALSPRWLLLGILMASCGGRLSPTKAPSMAAHVDPNLAPVGRLGDATTPSAYRLHLAIDPGESRFVGEITIEVELHEALHTIWLNQKKLTITNAVFERANQQFNLQTRRDSKDDELLGLAADERLDAGPGKLRIRFHGDQGDLQGLFRQIQDGRWYTYTDFEATDARAAFPCFDDPRFKAAWDLELQVPSGNLAFANAPELAREQRPDGTQLFRFATTRPLPTYLVAMAVGPFDVIEGRASATPLRVIAPKGHATHGRFVLENTGRWMLYLENYLGMAMPFPKLDFIAVPHFGGAMENPGLVTFSSNILLTGALPSEAQARRAAGVTTHELAHMWFGNLVTPHYWNDLWLNEAFATWLSDKAVANWQPAKARDILDIADKSTAFEIDHSIGGRVVREPITGPADIRAAFDAITYRKGGALLTMLEAWLGEDRMQRAVRAYLHKHAGGNVRARDWLASLHATVPDKKIDKVLRSFLEQPGIPRVALKLDCENGVQVELEQSRFLPISTPSEARQAEQARLWNFPVCLRYPNDAGDGTTRQCTTIATKRVSLKLATAKCPAWVLPNDRESGYYHYLLDRRGFAALAKVRLDKREQLGLVHNLAAALQSGDLGIAESLEELEPFAGTGSIHVQQVLVPLLYQLKQSVIGAGENEAFARLIRRWYGTRVAELGLAERQGEAEDDQILRPVLIHLLADLGDDRELQARARARVDAWLKNPRPMDMGLLDSLLQAAALRGGADLAARYVELMSTARDRRHTAVLAGALHAFLDAEILDLALQQSIPGQLNLPNLAPVLVRAMAQPELRTRLLRRLFSQRDALLAIGDAGEKSKKKRDQNFERVAPLFAALCDEAGKAAARRFAGTEFDAQPVIDAIAGCMAFRSAQGPSAQKAFAPSADSAPK